MQRRPIVFLSMLPEVLTHLKEKEAHALGLRIADKVEHELIEAGHVDAKVIVVSGATVTVYYPGSE